MAKSTGFPLFRHGTLGYWCKKVNGKFYYFGRDKDKAAIRWHREKDAIYAGQNPVFDGYPLHELATLYYTDLLNRHKVDGVPGEKHLQLVKSTLERMVEILGEEIDVDQLGPSNFSKLRADLFAPKKRDKPVRGKVYGLQVAKRSPTTVGNDIRRIKAFLAWCHDCEHIKKPRYGRQFPTEVRAAVKEKVDKSLTPEQIKKIVEAASRTLKPVIMLAINAGLGNTDIAEMTFADLGNLDRDKVWVDLPRRKTGTERRFILWPETVAAIKEYHSIRSEAVSELAFLTNCGLPWVRGNVNSIVTTFTKARNAAGVPSATFYDLRRTFQTVACDSLDFPAVKHIMGHAKKQRDMSERYTQHIPDPRLEAVCEHVRKWLFG